MLLHRLRCREPDLADSGDRRQWPFTLAPVAQLARDGIEFTSPITFLVGENGTGKSTIIEAIAEAYGADVRGGTSKPSYASSAEKSILGRSLILERSAGSRRQRGYFLRGETAFSLFGVLSGSRDLDYADLFAMSHGEGYLTVLTHRFSGPGMFLMDEPETPLSFSSTLRLVALMYAIRDVGGQVVCATHSPILAAIPGAQILQLDEDGINETTWDRLDVVDHWRRFLADPSIYLKHME
jgi:predicted ATPase